jgi:hypothetical protein
MNSKLNCRFVMSCMALLVIAFIQSSVATAQVGWRQMTVVASARDPAPTVVALYYPTSSAARNVSMGPFSVDAAIQAPPDALLQDPLWKDRIAHDRPGIRIGAIGHSVGGYTVLALAGGLADMARPTSHCTTNRTDDPIFCSMSPTSSVGTTVLESSADPRIRGVVAMAPAGVLFTADSLARITVPTLLYRAEEDRFLVPRFHVGWIAQNMPQAQVISVPKAWHFVFMDTPSMPLMSPDGDVGANPPSFDRSAFLDQLGRALPVFFDRVW